MQLFAEVSQDRFAPGCSHEADRQRTEKALRGYFNSPFRDNLYDSTNEAQGCQRYCNWVITDDESYLPPLTINYKDKIEETTVLFARKFDEEHLDIVEYVINYLNKNVER